MTCFSFPQEHAIRLSINADTSVGLICTDESVRELIVGYLYNEGLICSTADIAQLSVSSGHDMAEVSLAQKLESPIQQVRPSGLGGYQLNVPCALSRMPVKNTFSLAYLHDCARGMGSQSIKYARTGGVHCSALFDNQAQLSLFEDIGRHNTLDKLAGDCLLRGICTKDSLLITTGRVSSDMVRKAAILGASVIASFSVPTQRAYELACTVNITLIGYLSKPKETIYTAPERIR